MKTKVSSREELIRIVNEAPDGSDLNHLDISGIDSLEEVFMGLNKTLDVSKWDTTNVTCMIRTFYRSQVTLDISKWNTSGVLTMQGMFYN